MSEIKAIAPTGQSTSIQQPKERPSSYKVKSGDTLTSIAKKFGLTLEEFKGWTGLRSNSIKAGQEIPLPSAEVPKGKGIMALAKKYNMDYERFCKLNSITDKNYVSKNGEKFYVIRDLGATESNSAPQQSSPTQPTRPATPESTNPVQSTYCPHANTVESSIDPSKTVKIGNNTWTAKGLQTDAVKSGKKVPEYNQIKDDFYLSRPLPYINNGKIEATTEILRPTSSNGELKGKVVVLNPGHGGYQQNNGFFDAGTVFTTKDANNKEKPIEEWQVTRSYVNELADQLRAKGATVIVVTGAVQNGGMYAQKYLEGLFAGTKGSDDVKKVINKTKKSDMLFLSIHVESIKEKPNYNGASVITRSSVTDNGDIKLAENINKHAKLLYKNSSGNFESISPQHNKRGLYVLDAAGQVPGALLELGNIANESIKATLLSPTDRKKYMMGVAQAIVATMNE